jgi:hypothetical protein
MIAIKALPSSGLQDLTNGLSTMIPKSMSLTLQLIAYRSALLALRLTCRPLFAKSSSRDAHHQVLAEIARKII